MRSFLCMCALSLVTVNLACGGGSGGSDAGSRIFYVDAVSGNDANDGESESTAWKTLVKVNSCELAAGDTVKFKKGTVFSGRLELTRSGSADKPIVYDAYGTGTNPVFSGSREETGWSKATGTIYRKTIAYTPGETGAGIVLEDGTPLAFREWNTDASTSLGSSTGAFTYDPHDLSASTIYIRCTDSLDPSTHTITAGYYLIGIHADGVSNIAITHIRFRNYSCHGVSLKNASNISVTGCAAENIGGAVLSLSPLLYGGNGFEFTLNSSNCAVTDSSAGNIFDSGFSPQVFESGATTKNVTFENCYAGKCGFAGIEISVLAYNGSSGEKLENVSVSGCTVLDCGQGWSGVRYGSEGHGIRVKADAGAGSICGVSVTRTKVSGCKGSGIFISGESGTVDISRSLIYSNGKNGILCQDATDPNTTLKLRLTSSIVRDNIGSGVNGVAYNVVNGNGFELINNTFYGNTISVYADNCGGTAVLKNNVFYANGAAQTYLYVNQALAIAQSDYNCFAENGGNIIGWVSHAYSGVAAFNAATGLDQHSIGTDPLFVGEDDFHVQPASTSKNSGAAAGVAVDYEGNAYGATPSRGAYR